MKTIPSFSQGQEDLIVLYLMDYKQGGYYVDIGCYHPQDLNNTWLLYNSQWNGLCIDPNPDLKPQYDQTRPRDKFVSCAVAGEESTAEFHIGTYGVHSSLIESENSSGRKIQVPVRPLKKLLEEAGAPEIDFLSIDAEGAEVDILESFDWEKYKPELVLVEYNSADEINLELQKLVINKGYQLLFINNWNFLFTRKFEEHSQKLHGHQTDHALFPPIAEKINPRHQGEKTFEDWQNRGYVGEPVISFIIQSHNKSDQVLKLIPFFEKVKNCEILVIDDGSELYHSHRIADRLSQGNQWMLRANDLYEVITYDRAITMARGKLIVLLQDDDTFPDYQWIQNAVNLFSEIPELAILGGRNPIQLLPFEPTGDGQTIGEYTVNGSIAHTPNLLKQDLAPKASYPKTFQFAQTVNRAPMWIHRGHYINTLGSIDQSYAPFQADDYELCLRCWTSGLKVGWYPANVQVQSIGTGGMRIWNNQLTREQSIKNMRKVYQSYGDKLSAIDAAVEASNQQYWSSK